MAEKKFMDLAALQHYDERIKAFIDTADASALQAAKDYADGLADNYDAAGTAQTKMDELANGAVKANTEAIATLNGDASTDGSVAKAVADAKTELTTGAIAEAKAAADAAQADVDAIADKVGTIPDGKTIAEMIAEAQANATYDDTQIKADIKKNADDIAAINAADTGILAQAKSYADGKDAAIAAAKDAADAAQADVDALELKVGTVPEDKTVVQMIADAQAAATYDDTEVRGLISDNAQAIEAHKTAIDAKVTTLIGSDADKSVRTIANEELAAQLIPESAKESLDTLQEIAAWIQAHPDDVATMNAAIVKLQGIVAGIGGTDEEPTIVSYVTAAINALKTGDIQGALDRIAALEGDTHTHTNKALLDTYTQTEANLADAVAKKHDHANKDVLDAITAEKVSAWDAAEGNAKGYADGLNTAMDTRVAAIETELAGADTFAPITTAEIDALFAAKA